MNATPTIDKEPYQSAGTRKSKTGLSYSHALIWLPHYGLDAVSIFCLHNITDYLHINQ